MQKQTSILGRLLLVLIGLSLHCGDDSQSLDAQCEDITAEARSKLVVADTDLSCNTDADCALVRIDVSCLSGCGHPVAVRQDSSVLESVQSVETGLCAEFVQLGCPGPIALPCLPPIAGQSAVCNEGRCVVQNPE